MHRRRSGSKKYTPKASLPSKGAFSKTKKDSATSTKKSTKTASKKSTLKYRLQQLITFSSIKNPDLYKGAVKRVAEIGYAVSIGINDRIQFCEGCSVKSTTPFDAKRRDGAGGVSVAFESQMPEVRVATAETEAASLTESPESLMNAMEVVAENEGEGELIIPMAGKI